MKNKIIRFFIILVVLVTSIIILTSCNKVKTPAITASDVTVEFDGMTHGISATLSIAGGLSYEYTGIDNSYSSVLAPTQPGKYRVKIKYDSINLSEWESAKIDVNLDIILPYTVSDDGTELSEYIGGNKNVVIPSTYKGKQIVSIADDTYNEMNIESLKVPEKEFTLNPKAFANCSNFKTLIIYESTKLLSGQYPTGTSLEYGEPPTIIRADAFGEVAGIEKLTIPESVTTIEDGALSRIKIKKLILSSRLTLANQELSKTLKIVDVFRYKADPVLGDCFFMNCINIETIIFREGGYELGQKTFYNTASLQTLRLEGYVDGWIEDTFKGSNLISLEYTGDYMLSDANMPDTLTNIIILEGVTTLPNKAFYNMSQIESVTLPESLEIIGDEAFFRCSSLKKIVLPKSLKKIYNDAFSECSNMISVSFPENLELIETSVFSECISIEAIELPNTIRYLGRDTFYGCRKLKIVNIPTSLDYIPAGTFWGCYSLETIIVPKNIRTIGDRSFVDCYNLKKVTLSNGLEIIEPFAFYSTAIEELELPSTITTIEGQVFQSSNLKKLTILAETPPAISDTTFYLVPKSLIIYVPESAYSKYIEDPLWGVQNIQIITNTPIEP